MSYTTNYQRLNNIIGWFVFLISSFVYLSTMEATASFWDCGEYIACAYKLEVGHPPGAPVFLLIGRFFSLFAFGDTSKVGAMVNSMSALCSAFTILFLFWSITALARKIVDQSGELTLGRMIAVFGSGAVGALAYTFSDSFWFSAVEGEVYAMSSFFTAIVF
ncbi:MAG: glycosyltransferase family 117 protein, partial [Bacteroidota bacterium]